MEEKPEGQNICPYCGYDESAPEEVSDRLKPGSLLRGRFIVGNALGRGGFGITYIAWDNSLQRKVAIKEYLPRGMAAREPGGTTVSYDADTKEIFLHGVEKTLEESRKLAGFSHLESVVTVYDCFKENGTAYIVMELLRGENVKERLKREGAIPFGETLGIITPVLRTLSTVHKAGIIHRDISPDNIFICKDGKIKLLDFGSARTADSDPEKSRSIVLKHGYAPKEQYSSRGRQGPLTDIYEVCATVYKMLTGVTPVDSLERMDGEDELRDISELAQLPQTAAAAVMKGMALNAADRFQSADELLDELTKEMTEPAGDEATETEPAPAVKKDIADDEDETKTLLTETERKTGVSLENLPEEDAPENDFHRKVKRIEADRKQESNDGKALPEKKDNQKSGFLNKKQIRIIAVALVLSVFTGCVAGIFSTRRAMPVAFDDSGTGDGKVLEEVGAEEATRENHTDEDGETITFPVPGEGMTGTSDKTTTKKETTTKREISRDEWSAAYKKFLLSFLKDNPDAAVTNSEGYAANDFGFIYLDEDDVPELVIVPHLTDRGSKAALYYYDGKDVRKVGEYGPYGAFEYVIGKGIVICDSTHYPFGHVEYNKFENGKVMPMAVFHYDYTQETDGRPEEYDYYIDEKPVTYEKYRKEEKRIRNECDADKAVYTKTFIYYNLNEYMIDSYFD